MLIKQKAETNVNFGLKPSDRSIEMRLNYGIINLDKPKGPTSHQTVDYLKRILNIFKAGHSGSLDPAVTGVLPIALGRSTRIINQVLKAGKEYVCIMHLHSVVKEDVIRSEIKKMVGAITQMPPVKSAVKRQNRVRNIYGIEILEIDGQDVLFAMKCQAGTYVRKWVHDFGKLLGVGAHMAELRRTQAGVFNENNLVRLQDLADDFHFWKEKKDNNLIEKILPVESVIANMKKIIVLDSSVDSLCHGANLNNPGISALSEDIVKNEEVAIMSLKGELIALGTSVLTSNDMMKNKGLAVKTHTVFMLPGTYPKKN